MKLAINQPYFFPYVGYFSLISCADKFIIFDTSQYIRHGWVNRNRILKPDGQDWQYIKMPLKKHSNRNSIVDIEVKDDNWKERLLGQIQHYKKKAPHFKESRAFIEKSLDFEYQNLSKVNTFLLETTCEYLDISFNYEIYSEMEFQHQEPEKPGEWALYISEALGASTYINLPGGKEIFDKERFGLKNIDLNFIAADLSNYRQDRKESFFPALSVIDVLMYKGRKECKEIIKNFKLTE